MTAPPHSARAPVYFWAAVALGAAIRIAVLVLSPENPDTRSFEDTVRAGAGGLYNGLTRFNYSPLFAFVLYGLGGAAAAVGAPLRLLLGAFLLATDAATTAVLFRRAGPCAAALFFLNPVSVFVSSFHLQFDGLAILFLVLAVAGFRERGSETRPGRAAAWMSLSLLAKHVAWFHPLLFVTRASRRREMLFSSLPYAVFALSFLPFASSWSGIRTAVLGYRSLSEAYGLRGLFPTAPDRLLTILFAASLLAAVWLLRRVALAPAALLLFLVTLLFIPGIAQYYFVWPIALGALCGGGAGFFVYTVVVTLFLAGSPDGLHFQEKFRHLPDWSGPWWACAFWLLWEIRRLSAARAMGLRARADDRPAVVR
ncbi:MAG: hypothetical protein ABR610_04825 [Thermoanaerobaculia bacterium]|nr:hypothetical protein [Acidobacteriota bacterium]